MEQAHKSLTTQCLPGNRPQHSKINYQVLKWKTNKKVSMVQLLLVLARLLLSMCCVVYWHCPFTLNAALKVLLCIMQRLQLLPGT